MKSLRIIPRRTDSRVTVIFDQESLDRVAALKAEYGEITTITPSNSLILRRALDLLKQRVDGITTPHEAKAEEAELRRHV